MPPPSLIVFYLDIELEAAGLCGQCLDVEVLEVCPRLIGLDQELDLGAQRRPCGLLAMTEKGKKIPLKPPFRKGEG